MFGDFSIKLNRVLRLIWLKISFLSFFSISVALAGVFKIFNADAGAAIFALLAISALFLVLTAIFWNARDRTVATLLGASFTAIACLLLVKFLPLPSHGQSSVSSPSQISLGAEEPCKAAMKYGYKCAVEDLDAAIDSSNLDAVKILIRGGVPLDSKLPVNGYSWQDDALDRLTKTAPSFQDAVLRFAQGVGALKSSENCTYRTYQRVKYEVTGGTAMRIDPVAFQFTDAASCALVFHPGLYCAFKRIGVHEGNSLQAYEKFDRTALGGDDEQFFEAIDRARRCEYLEQRGLYDAWEQSEIIRKKYGN